MPTYQATWESEPHRILHTVQRTEYLNRIFFGQHHLPLSIGSALVQNLYPKSDFLPHLRNSVSGP